MCWSIGLKRPPSELPGKLICQGSLSPVTLTLNNHPLLPDLTLPAPHTALVAVRGHCVKAVGILYFQ